MFQSIRIVPRLEGIVPRSEGIVRRVFLLLNQFPVAKRMIYFILTNTREEQRSERSASNIVGP